MRGVTKHFVYDCTFETRLHGFAVPTTTLRTRRRVRRKPNAKPTYTEANATASQAETNVTAAQSPRTASNFAEDAHDQQGDKSPRRSVKGSVGNDLAEHWRSEGRRTMCKRDEGGRIVDPSEWPASSASQDSQGAIVLCMYS